jgi:hypothetical protein
VRRLGRGWVGAIAVAAIAAGCGGTASDGLGLCPRGATLVEELDPYGHRREWCERDEGVPHGRWVAWHPSGAPSVEGQMRDGERVGEWRFYSETGDVIERIDYDASREATPD